MDILKKVGFGVAIIGVLALVFTGGFIARGKLNPGCNDQDILIHEMQERIKRDSSLMEVLQKSSLECNKQAMGTIMQYERAVSYTHLDVYKRQILCLKEIIIFRSM